MSTGRKPADVLARSPRPEPRASIWPLIRDRRVVTVGEIASKLALDRKTVSGFLNALENSGRLSGTNPGGREARVYTLVNDTGPELPRVRADGSEVTAGRGTEQLWRTMKILPNFTIVELAAAASTSVRVIAHGQAEDYVRWLLRAEYLIVTVRGRPHRPARYRLVRNTGPLPPMIQRMPQVWDQNLKQVVWTGGAS